MEKSFKGINCLVEYRKLVNQVIRMEYQNKMNVAWIPDQVRNDESKFDQLLEIHLQNHSEINFEIKSLSNTKG